MKDFPLNKSALTAELKALGVPFGFYESLDTLYAKVKLARLRDSLPEGPADEPEVVAEPVIEPVIEPVVAEEEPVIVEEPAPVAKPRKKKASVEAA